MLNRALFSRPSLRAITRCEASESAVPEQTYQPRTRTGYVSGDSINSVTLLGNLGSDPEVHEFADGSSVIRMNLVTSTPYFNSESQTWDSRPEWHNVQVRRNGDISYLLGRAKKGAKVHVDGSIASSKKEFDDGRVQYYKYINVPRNQKVRVIWSPTDTDE